MPERVTDEDFDLLNELGVETTPIAKGGRTAREQRIVTGFEEIERFFEEHGRAPQHGEGRDIFERLYAVRLDRIRGSEECRAVLSGLDRHGLLTAPVSADAVEAVAAANDDELLAALGVEPDADDSDVTKLVHVRSNTERQAAEDVARRAPCPDFETFRPTFEQAQRDLEAGLLQTVKYERKDDGEKFKPGDLFIIGGQKALIASEGEAVDKPLFPGDRRLRVIFDNGTEANLWLRSLKRALYEEGNRQILPASTDAAPLFADHLADDDTHVAYNRALSPMAKQSVDGRDESTLLLFSHRPRSSDHHLAIRAWGFELLPRNQNFSPCEMPQRLISELGQIFRGTKRESVRFSMSSGTPLMSLPFRWGLNNDAYNFMSSKFRTLAGLNGWDTRSAKRTSMSPFPASRIACPACGMFRHLYVVEYPTE